MKDESQKRTPSDPFGGINPDDASAMMAKIKQLEKTMPKTNPGMRGMDVSPSMEEIMNKIPAEIRTNVKAQEVSNDKLDKLLSKLKDTFFQYEKVTLPSLGKFYQNGEAPANGVIHVRPMTGNEQEILATQRFVLKTEGMSMIFKNCVQEEIKPEEWLIEDRTFLVIYLRGISDGNKYDITVRCPACDHKMETEIDLNLPVKFCPEELTIDSLKGTLPISKFNFTYRLMNYKDNQAIEKHSERIKKNEISIVDDTFSYVAATLLMNLEDLTDFESIMKLVKNLPLEDMNFLRKTLNNSGFGTETVLELGCTMCGELFKAELPFDINFFFPRVKKEKLTRQ